MEVARFVVQCVRELCWRVQRGWGLWALEATARPQVSTDGLQGLPASEGVYGERVPHSGCWGHCRAVSARFEFRCCGVAEKHMWLYLRCYCC